MQREGFNRTSVIMHWLLAVSIFFLFLSSWWMMGLPLPSPELQFRAFPFQLHKNVGLTAVILLLVLLYMRLRHRPAPPAQSDMKPWMHNMAVVAHVGIYLLILAVCVTGYLSSAHTRWDTSFWWLFDFPRIAEPNEELNEYWGELHTYFAWALLAFIAAHVSGAIYHSFRNDGIVRRMMRW
ncbi:cytochrome b [Methylophaga sp. OBS3]|uniref:cytochrome b n=1 Tax=Methylophaga sp. OBS3 TaxID=2991934 RepID=UPI0022516B04|nr:cytochrome b/b6 domain-containing protein [Methylophaga sp. OBS3]MCX4188807.1 cytochrome b/b6 domain-containing protein [Methylophaga sp. OBS3]